MIDRTTRRAGAPRTALRAPQEGQILCCGCATIDFGFWYDPLGIPDSGTADQGVDATNECDGGDLEDVSDSFDGSWTVVNPAIATVDHYGTHTGISIGSTTSKAFAQLNDNDAPKLCPLHGYNPSGNDNTQPQITDITPGTVLVGTTNVQLEIDGYGFGSSPTVNLPQGVTNLGNQASTNTKILINVAVSINAPIGPDSLTVTAANQTSGPGAFTLDGPFYMVVEGDTITTCSGCRTTVERLTSYQIYNFSGSPSGTVNIGEPSGSTVESGWNCMQGDPGLETQACPYSATSGYFTDGWNMSSDNFTPVGCGFNADDHWNWCPTGKSIGHLKGYVHTNAIQINGSTMPPQSNQMKAGTIINP